MVIASPLATTGDARFPADICERALDARDPRFDGLFYVGITTTGIYCRPVCPARVSHTERRRFFDSAAAAERAGFRPCLRCRPELAPGRAGIDAVSRLAHVAANRIGAGALNGHTVADLAGDLGVSERHLRRALERELGVSPLDLAQTHRLLLAKQLLADTSLSVTHIAFASGFQSLRRFNSAFHEQYRLSPSAVRRNPRPLRVSRTKRPSSGSGFVRLALGYRPPLDWSQLINSLTGVAIPGTELVRGGRYFRTVSLDGRRGVIAAEDGERGSGFGDRAVRKNHLNVGISVSLLPVLMPLLARIRHLFDLDAEPAAVDSHLSEGGLGELVRTRPGLRIPGTLDGFEAVLSALLLDSRRSGETARAVAQELGEPAETEIPGLDRYLPTPQHIAEAGVPRLVSLGLSLPGARLLSSLASRVAEGVLRLDPARDAEATRQSLVEIGDVDDTLATGIVTRALHWPDAFPASDPELVRAAGVSSAARLRTLAEKWRPWRAYAAMHLRSHGTSAVLAG